MIRARLAGLVVVLLMAALARGAEQPNDADGDGIWDNHEGLLGTDPHQADVFHIIAKDGAKSAERRGRPNYDATKDILSIEFCHVGGNRYLWRASFAAPPRLDDTVFHLYVDGDASEATGRKGAAGSATTGTDYMLSVIGGRGAVTAYDAAGDRRSGPRVTFALQKNQLIVSADVDMAWHGGKVVSALYVLCHTKTGSNQSPAMSDSIGKRLVTDVPVLDRKKIMRPGDYTRNYRVQATFGIDLLRRVLRDDHTVVVPHDHLELDGFVVDDATSRRWPHVRRESEDARLSTRVEKPGRYHVGFMMYDDSRDERVGLYIDGKMRGVALGNQDNNRTWLYWLDEPIDFQIGQRVELRALGSSGKHGICNILFLTAPPEIRKIRFAVENMLTANSVDHPGQVIISWSTTWPCLTRFEYGSDTDYGKTVEHAGHCLVHRVVLAGLDPNATFHGRAVGTTRDGRLYRGHDFVFHASASAANPSRFDTSSVRLSVANTHSHPVTQWPTTTGVPFPQGQLGSVEHIRLLCGDVEVPMQVRLMARWPDQSVKWALVTFLMDAPAEGSADYRIEFGRQVKRPNVSRALKVARHDGGVTVDTGAITFQIDEHGNLTGVQKGGSQRLTQNACCHTRVVDEKGHVSTTKQAAARIVIEEAGPLRTVIHITSDLQDAGGGKLLQVGKRIEAYRDRALIRVQHTFVVTVPETFVNIEQLQYRIPISANGSVWNVAAEGGKVIRLDGHRESVIQRFDGELVTSEGNGKTPINGKIIGSIVADDPVGGGVAVRDFWQNYPKGFSLDAGSLVVELCPDFEPGIYDQFPFEKEGHHLYYYLLDGHYRLKHGLSKTDDLLLSFESGAEAAWSCTLFQQPPLATASPEWYCESKAFYDVEPRNTERFPLYEAAIDKNLAAYADRRGRQHDFGMLNFGDWYGERGTNWGNIEYDTQHAFFLEYIRSGNPTAFWLGQAAEAHNRDIDTVHWSENPDEVGAVYIHQMCHVGEYYDHPVPGSLGFPRAGYTVSHAWTEGHFDHYFLTGDRRSRATACAIADFFIRKELGRPYDFSTCRVPGWHLIMLASAYAATNDPYYLNAAKVVVQRVLETQDTSPRPLPAYQAKGRKPYQQGGWSRMMVPGHCCCEPRHRGNAGFMVAVLLSGLKYYHDVTGDPRVKDAIIQGAHYLIDETYSDKVKGFRYTSCPKTDYRAGTTPLMVEGIARAYLWTHNDQFRRVLVEALPLGAGGSGYGKGFSMYYRMAPRVLADLHAAGLTLGGDSQSKTQPAGSK